MKRINPGTVTLFVCAILFGLVAAYTAKRYLEPKPVAEKTVPVLSAKINLPHGARLRHEDMELLKKPADQVPPGAMSSPARAYLRVLKSTIMAGQPITEEAMYPVGQMPTLEEQVPAGMRAVTFPVDRNNALAGMLMPSTNVDVALTVKGDKSDLQGLKTLTILRRVKVLATSHHFFKAEQKVNDGIHSVTVAVTPEQANKLILSQKYGTLSVTLHGPEDTETVSVVDAGADTDEVTPMSLLGLKTPPPPQPVKPEPVTKTQVWRGTSMTELTFKENQIQDEKVITAPVTAHAEPVVPAAQPNAYVKVSETKREGK